MVNGYTFYKYAKAGKVWVCSSKSSANCQAKIRYDKIRVAPIVFDHNHAPPQYYITKNGEYVKIV